MSEHELLRYNELYVLCWKMVKRYMQGMTTSSDMDKFWNDLYTEGQVLYERFMDLNRDKVYIIVNASVNMVQDAYRNLHRPAVDPQQMSIFDREVEE